MGYVQLAMYAPIFAALIATLTGLTVLETVVPKPSSRALVVRSLQFAGLAAMASLAATTGWMGWHEHSVGGRARDAVLAWILFYGPLSIAFGQMVALVLWLIQRPCEHSSPP